MERRTEGREEGKEGEEKKGRKERREGEKKEGGKEGRKQGRGRAWSMGIKIREGSRGTPGNYEQPSVPC